MLCWLQLWEIFIQKKSLWLRLPQSWPRELTELFCYFDHYQKIRKMRSQSLLSDCAPYVFVIGSWLAWNSVGLAGLELTEIDMPLPPECRDQHMPPCLPLSLTIFITRMCTHHSKLAHSQINWFGLSIHVHSAISMGETDYLIALVKRKGERKIVLWICNWEGSRGFLKKDHWAKLCEGCLGLQSSEPGRDGSRWKEFHCTGPEVEETVCFKHVAKLDRKGKESWVWDWGKERMVCLVKIEGHKFRFDLYLRTMETWVWLSGTFI